MPMMPEDRKYLVVFRRSGTQNWYMSESNRQLMTIEEARAAVRSLHAKSTVAAATQWGIVELQAVTRSVRIDILAFRPEEVED